MKFSKYKSSNQCKGIIGLNKVGNWELVAECFGMSDRQISNTIHMLNDELTKV